mmetsp:Transcript_100885/g.289596  ORF Transcript_100885/g.289596 Transcript_100885/m.289596 type:complete len:96 (+) Transcript_100885:774-1061(+)
MKRLAAPPQLTQYAMARTRESPFAKQMAAVPVTQPYSTHTNPLIAIEEYGSNGSPLFTFRSLQNSITVGIGDSANATDDSAHKTLYSQWFRQELC